MVKLVLYLCDYCEDFCLKHTPDGCIGFPFKFRKVEVTIQEMYDVTPTTGDSGHKVVK